MLLYFDLKLFRLPELVTCKIGTIIYNVHKFCFHRLQNSRRGSKLSFTPNISHLGLD